MTIKGTFKVPIYNCRVFIIVSDTIPLCIKNVFKKFGNSNATVDEQVDGFFTRFEDNKYYIFLDKTSLNHNILNHEKSHLVEYILKDRGIRPVDEVRSYLDGFISHKIHLFLKKKNIKAV